jgi:tagaturonate reductase
LKNCNYFCNSLVDRIVPGAPGADQRSAIQSDLGYTDDLMILSEVYRLWAIEADQEKVKEVLSFSRADEGVAIAADITKFRELKLRLLNGTHTLSCGLAILAGYPTVKESMEEEEIPGYMHSLMTQNIIPALTANGIDEQEAMQFAGKVLDRFRNPFIEHKWTSISVQYTSKMRMRTLPVLLKLYETKEVKPELFALGFAAYLLFMKSEKSGNGSFTGKMNGVDFTIQDDKAAYFYEKWNNTGIDDFVINILQDESLWGTNLAALDGFADMVNRSIQSLINDGAKGAIRNLITNKKAEQL